MDDRSNGSGMTAIVGIVAIIAILLLVYFLFLRGPSPDGQFEGDLDVDINTEQVDPPTPDPGN